jgi:chromosome segregation ATPase
MAQHMINYPWGSSEVTHVPPGAHIESEEIAALKAERDRLQKERDGIELELCQRAEKWEAERDQLRAANTEWKRQCARLRAALQHIYDLDIRLTTETVEEIARRVLEGK